MKPSTKAFIKGFCEGYIRACYILMPAALVGFVLWQIEKVYFVTR